VRVIRQMLDVTPDLDKLGLSSHHNLIQYARRDGVVQNF